MGKESLMLYLAELVESPLKILLTVNKHQVYSVGYSHFTPEACPLTQVRSFIPRLCSKSIIYEII